MTTFTMQDLNNSIPVTKEEDEAMEALAKLGAGVDLKDMFTEMGQDLTAPPIGTTVPNPTIQDIINTICAQLQLLTSVISQNQGNSHGGEAGEKSLQECVSATLEQAEWFKEMVDKQVEELVDDKDFAYEINSEVEDWFSNSFSLDDHVDIEAEVQSKLEDIVEERLAELVEEKLQNANISISF